VKKAWVFGAAGAVVAIGAGAAIGFGGGSGQSPPTTKPPLATAKVVKTTLTETEQVDGTLGYGATKHLPAASKGTVTWLPAEGATVHTGKPVYQVDGQPVLLLDGNVPPYRMMKSGDSGADVHQLEQNLKKLGYSGFTVDDYFDSGTTQAVLQLQEETGMQETGTIGPGQMIVAAGDIRIAEHSVEVGDQVGGGKPVVSYTGTARTVTVALDVAKQQLVNKGIQATVTLPDGSAVTGTVSSVGAVATSTNSGTSKTTTITVLIAIENQQALGKLQSAPVDVTLVSSKHKDVLAVPVSALIALPGGQYAVQLVNGQSISPVPVKTGVFAQGKVQISGVGIAAGTLVGVPA
jgi:peptidoglycan hydrolase-like protein with peptidoglycan-binding domain